MASASRYSSMMLSKLAAASSSRAAFVAAPTTSRAFSTSLVLRDSRRSTPPAANDAQPRVRHNPLVGNYVPPQPVQLKPDTVPPVSTEHPNSPKPPMSSAEVPPNADMPPPPPPPPPPSSSSSKAAGEQSTRPSLRQSLDPNYKPEFAYDAVAADSAVKAATDAAAADQPSSDYKRIDIMDIISSKADGFSSKLRAFDPSAMPTIRTAPVVGRTVHIKRERAFGPNTALSASSAFRTLGRIIVQERVPFKNRQQKYHERPGLKRKRLSSERWKARFRTGFTATVNRVMELKRQGW